MQEPFTQNKTQNDEKKKNTTDPPQKPMLIQEDRINSELVKKFMTEYKTTLLSLRNQDWKKVKVETKKINKLLPNIPKCNTTEQNMLIYARVNITERPNG